MLSINRIFYVPVMLKCHILHLRLRVSIEIFRTRFDSSVLHLESLRVKLGIFLFHILIGTIGAASS
jgi:hypothetical protein